MTEGSNGFDPEAIESYAREYLDIEADKKALAEEFGKRRKALNMKQKEVLDAAYEDGLPKRLLKKVIKRVQLVQKIHELDVDTDTGETDEGFANMVECAKAGLPLFAAAVGDGPTL